MVIFDQESMTRRLNGISPRSRTVFALTCAERLLPMYEAFCVDSTKGRWEYLRSAANNLWGQLFEGIVRPDPEFLATYPSLAPNDDWPTSEFTPLHPLAENAALALGSAWECHVSGESKKALWAADQANEAIDYMAQHLGGIDYRQPSAEASLDQSDLVQRELRQQLDDLATLEHVSEGDHTYVSMITTLREQSQRDGRILKIAAEAL